MTCHCQLTTAVGLGDLASSCNSIRRCADAGTNGPRTDHARTDKDSHGTVLNRTRLRESSIGVSQLDKPRAGLNVSVRVYYLETRAAFAELPKLYQQTRPSVVPG